MEFVACCTVIINGFFLLKILEGLQSEDTSVRAASHWYSILPCVVTLAKTASEYGEALATYQINIFLG